MYPYLQKAPSTDPECIYICVTCERHAPRALVRVRHHRIGPSNGTPASRGGVGNCDCVPVEHMFYL